MVRSQYVHLLLVLGHRRRVGSILIVTIRLIFGIMNFFFITIFIVATDVYDLSAAHPTVRSVVARIHAVLESVAKLLENGRCSRRDATACLDVEDDVHVVGGSDDS